MVGHSGAAARVNQGEQLLFLTDERLRQGVELMFFAYRAMVSDADRILEDIGYGRAHHRALHFIGRRPGMMVTELIDILGVTKQSLNRVLRQLIGDGLVENRVGPDDRRQRLLYLSDEGAALAARLTAAQHDRMRRVFMEAGPEAVHGFREVLAGMIDAGERDRILALIQGRPAE